MTLSVTARGDGTWAIEVDEADRTTHHVVTVPSGFGASLGLGASEAALVRGSFAFLLEREPASSILERFSLDVIPRYFPDYPAEIARYLPGSRTERS